MHSAIKVTLGALALILPAYTMGAGCRSGPPSPSQQHGGCNGWEYKVQYSLPEPRPERSGEGAPLATSITPNEQELSTLGSEGWELAGLYLEQETAYARLNASAPLEPNVRPQRLVLIFKRKTCE
jgi:hypothetical protein